MDIRRINDTLSVSPQIAATDIEEISRLGFRSIICNRPDGESPIQPSANDIATAAAVAGLSFRHIPVVGGNIADASVSEFKAALAVLPKPILGYCRTRNADNHTLGTGDAR